MPVAPRRRLVLPTVILALLGAAATVTPSAQASTPADGWRVVDTQVPITITRGTAVHGPHSALLAAGTTPGGSPQAFVTSGPTRSTWKVNYDAGFTANAPAQAAFQRAVDLWSLNVASKATIVVDASLRALGPGQLGGAGPAGFAADDGGNYTSASTAYPLALANAIASRQAGRAVDLSPPSASSPDGEDIDAEFSSDPTTFYYGADPALIPPTQYDFTTVVLHELAHGMGFIGALTVERRADGTLVGTYDSGASKPYPFIYDRFTETGDGVPMLARPRGSTSLRDALTSNNGYWYGPKGSAADRGREPRLYVPNDPSAAGADASGWQQGSSYSHLSDASYPNGDPDGLMTPYAEAGEVIREPGDVLLGMLQDMGWGAPEPPGARYTALTPVRILNTLTGLGQAGNRPVRLGTTTDLNVETSLSGVPAEATAVVLNVTSRGASSTTDLRVYPTPRAPGAPVPDVSNLNVERGQTRANLVTVPVGAGHQVRLRNASGSTDVLVDLAGYYAPAAAADLHPVTPVRVLDTGTGAGVPGGIQGRIGPGQTVDLTVTGSHGVPADGSAQAVVLGVTAAFPTSGTDVRVYPTPTDGSVPEVSNLNAAAGRNVPNLVVVKIGDGGRVRLRNASGSVTLLADLDGWFGTGTSGSVFRPTRPTRVLDTRHSLGTSGPTRLGAGGTVDVAVRDSSGADVVAGVPSSATAAVLNLTGVAASGPTDVRGYPSPAGSVPTVSNLNLVKGQTAADLALLQLGSAGVQLRNNSGTVALLADVAGWFGPE